MLRGRLHVSAIKAKGPSVQGRLVTLKCLLRAWTCTDPALGLMMDNWSQGGCSDNLFTLYGRHGHYELWLKLSICVFMRQSAYAILHLLLKCTTKKRRKMLTANIAWSQVEAGTTVKVMHLSCVNTSSSAAATDHWSGH